MEHGFDRGADFNETKNKFIEEYKIVCDTVTYDSKEYKSKINKLVYLNLAMIQLKNGSRISEAVEAFKLFLDAMIHRESKKRVIVKISKSQAIKTNKHGEKYETKARYREIEYPGWVIIDEPKLLYSHLLGMNNPKNNTLNYLLRRFKLNTRSLRYAFINYALYEKKHPMPAVARFVGHANINQLVTYTQVKESDKLFDNIYLIIIFFLTLK